MSSGESRKSWIAEGTIVVGLFTFLGYLYAFNYESGYAGFFKIPCQFINISLPQIIMTGSIIIAIAISLFWFIWYSPALINSKSLEFLLSLTIFILILIIIFGDLFVYGSGWQIVYGLRWQEFVTIACSVILAAVVFNFLFQHIIQKNRHVSTSNSLFRSTNIAFFILCIIISILLIAWIGKKAASSQEEFLVRGAIPQSNQPEMVVLRIYGDNLICAEFDRQKRIVKTTFAVFKLANESRQGLDAKQNLISTPLLRLEKVGPLKVEK